MIIDHHEKLLFEPEIDLLSRLLLPLAGPEEFDSDEMDKLPEDLQYLPPDKTREPDADIRIMLIETILMVRFRGFPPLIYSFSNVLYLSISSCARTRNAATTSRTRTRTSYCASCTRATRTRRCVTCARSS